jgi:hypothetical protein
MRYIDHKQLRRFKALTELQAANAAIALLTDDKRGEFIDKNESKCSALRTALWAVGSTKCWYSEASLQECEGQVEHYRPKKRLSGAQHVGYWWRAFDWKNLRLAHPTVNRRITDYLTGKKSGKGSYFPLQDESTRATCEAEERNERPVLLDPTVPFDARLICFSEESGSPKPRYEKDVDPWLHKRAEDSIEYYHLNEGTWNARRQDLMGEVRKLCETLDALVLQEPRNEVEYNEVIDELVSKYINPFAEFSAACLQIVREKGLLEHVAAGLT